MSFLKRTLFLVVTLSVATNLIFGNVVYAKKFEITDKDIERIKTGLDWARTFSNIAISDDKLKTTLNTVIKTSETGVDITYGLISLAALNEMEFIDMVVSQKYKQKLKDFYRGLTPVSVESYQILSVKFSTGGGLFFVFGACKMRKHVKF